MDDNSKTVWLLVVPTFATLITAAISGYVAVQMATISARVDHVSQKVETVATDIRKVELATNSMKDALVDATAKASFAEGKIAEKSDEKKRVSDQAAKGARDKAVVDKQVLDNALRLKKGGTP